MNVVITGTSRGIGLELVKQAVAAKCKVLAVARNPGPELEALPVETLAVELTSPEAPAQIADAVKSWGHVDLLINNAGVYMKDATAEDFLKTFHVNSVVPFFVTKALAPLLQKSKTPRTVHITSKMGSIEDNTSGGSYSYRASKAALNMINKSLSVDNPWLSTVVVHPGWVQTDMGGSQAPVKPLDSAKGIWNIATHIKSEDTGAFFNYTGDEIPW